MQPLSIRFILDVSQQNTQATVQIRQYEWNSRKFCIGLRNGVEAVTLQDVSVFFHARKSDGTVILNECSIVDNCAECLFTPQLVVAAGTIVCQLIVYGSENELLFSPAFTLVVGEPLQAVSPIVSSSEYAALVSTINRVPYTFIKYAQSAPAANSDMQDAPGNWIGFYTGTAHSAPADYTAYTWYRIRGDRGERGEKGFPGVSVRIGSTTTLEPGGTAAVTNSGTLSEPVLHFSIPRGAPGNISKVDGVAPAAADAGDLKLYAVRYAAQSLNSTQKATACANIGAQSALSRTVGAATPTAHMANTTTLPVSRYGKVCVFTFGGFSLASAVTDSAWLPVYTLPEGYRPADTIYPIAMTSTGIMLQVKVSVAGSVELRGTAAAGAAVLGQIVYITA